MNKNVIKSKTMSTGYKINEQDELYYVTFQIVRWIDVFTRQVWTHENHAEIVYRNQFMDSKINYMHENPVRAGIVEKQEDYFYSSARNYAGLDGVLEVTVIPFQ